MAPCGLATPATIGPCCCWMACHNNTVCLLQNVVRRFPPPPPTEITHRNRFVGHGCDKFSWVSHLFLPLAGAASQATSKDLARLDSDVYTIDEEFGGDDNPSSCWETKTFLVVDGYWADSPRHLQ
ncbi:unnamed protein product [Calypogeia fissa]